MESIVWRSVGAVDPLKLVEARNQAHHAMQLPACLGSHCLRPLSRGLWPY